MTKKYLARCNGIPCFVYLKGDYICFNTTGFDGEETGVVMFRSGCRELCSLDIEWVDKPPKKIIELCFSADAPSKNKK